MIVDYKGRPFTKEQAQACVGPGWADLVSRAYDLLPDGATLQQVKEKFGGLRFYADPHVDGIDAIENESETVCEDCGKPGHPEPSPSWILTLCDECRTR